jgi:ectoine hydroxylase-related dioxygenase (phytanoyl-CoA dioxygenase family)
LPGSHGLKQLSVESEDDLRAIEFRAIAPSGSLLVLDGGIWHGANLNRTSKPRRVVKLLFTRQWIRPQIDYSVVTTSEVLNRLTVRVKRLLRLTPTA